MTNKKQITLTAKSFRNTLKGIGLPLSVKLAKALRNGDRFKILDALKNAGYHIDTVVVMGSCPDDGCDHGYYVVSRSGKKVGKLNFSCCGIDLSAGVHGDPDD